MGKLSSLPAILSQNWKIFCCTVTKAICSAVSVSEAQILEFEFSGSVFPILCSLLRHVTCLATDFLQFCQTCLMPLSWWKLFDGNVAGHQTTKLNYFITLLQSNLDYPYLNTSIIQTLQLCLCTIKQINVYNLDYWNPQLSESFYLVPATFITVAIQP